MTDIIILPLFVLVIGLRAIIARILLLSERWLDKELELELKRKLLVNITLAFAPLPDAPY